MCYRLIHGCCWWNIVITWSGFFGLWTMNYKIRWLKSWLRFLLREVYNLDRETAKIRPLYPCRCWVFNSNVINTGLVQPFGPAPVGSMSKKTLIFHCGRCETLPTPAITAFFRKAGVGKVSQRPLSKLKVSVYQIRLKAGVGKVSQRPLSIIKVWQLLYK